MQRPAAYERLGDWTRGPQNLSPCCVCAARLGEEARQAAQAWIMGHGPCLCSPVGAQCCSGPGSAHLVLTFSLFLLSSTVTRSFVQTSSEQHVTVALSVPKIVSPTDWSLQQDPSRIFQCPGWLHSLLCFRHILPLLQQRLSPGPLCRTVAYAVQRRLPTSTCSATHLAQSSSQRHTCSIVRPAWCHGLHRSYSGRTNSGVIFTCAQHTASASLQVPVKLAGPFRHVPRTHRAAPQQL